MRILVAGATGVVGQRLVPLLIQRGHTIIGTTRTPEKIAELIRAGAEGTVLDLLAPEAVMQAVRLARPDVIVHQATALKGALRPSRSLASFNATNRLRADGAAHLVAAARDTGAHVVAQSFAGWPYAREGGPVKTEDDPLDPAPPGVLRPVLDAIKALETTVLGAGGTVLRYGGFYGPGTSLDAHGEHVALLRRRQLPLIGPGTGVWSFVHVDDVAAATAAAIEQRAAGIYNVADDDPARVAEWLPMAARLAGARAPLRIPRWLGRLIAGAHVDVMMNEARGASNAKAKRVLGWTPRFASWRDGFPITIGSRAG